MVRGSLFSHRDFDEVVTLYEKDEPFYLYTGQGPSSEAMHLGHLIAFVFTKWLQDVFRVPLVVQLTDNEKFLAKRELLSLGEANRLACENAKDIIAVGFDRELTFLFTDSEYIASGSESSKGFYRSILQISKLVHQKDVEATFGFQGEQPIGLWGCEFISCCIQNCLQAGKRFVMLRAMHRNASDCIAVVLALVVVEEQHFQHCSSCVFSFYPRALASRCASIAQFNVRFTHTRINDVVLLRKTKTQNKTLACHQAR